MKKLMILSMILLTGAGCGSADRATSTETSFVMIAFGETGDTDLQYGFSKTGLLLETQEGENEPQMIGKVTEGELNAISKMAAKTQDIESFKEEPGNFNRKILIQNENSYRSYYWQTSSDTVPGQLNELYEALFKLVAKAQQQ